MSTGGTLYDHRASAQTVAPAGEEYAVRRKKTRAPSQHPCKTLSASSLLLGAHLGQSVYPCMRGAADVRARQRRRSARRVMSRSPGACGSLWAQGRLPPHSFCKDRVHATVVGRQLVTIAATAGNAAPPPEVNREFPAAGHQREDGPEQCAWALRARKKAP